MNASDARAGRRVQVVALNDGLRFSSVSLSRNRRATGIGVLMYPIGNLDPTAWAVRHHDMTLAVYDLAEIELSTVGPVASWTRTAEQEETRQRIEAQERDRLQAERVARVQADRRERVLLEMTRQREREGLRRAEQLRELEQNLRTAERLAVDALAALDQAREALAASRENRTARRRSPQHPPRLPPPTPPSSDAPKDDPAERFLDI